MHAAGVEVRPLVQITGEAEFNEVYMTDVRVPDRDRIGDIGDGWRVSMTTLMNERVTIGGAVAQRESGPIGDLMRLWRGLPEERRRDPVSRDKVAALWTEAEVLRLTNLRATQNRKAGVAGPEGSVSKLAFAEVNKRIYELAVNLMGPDGLLIDSYEFVRPAAGPAHRRRRPPQDVPALAGELDRGRHVRDPEATSWASASSASPASPAPTRRCRGRTSRATDARRRASAEDADVVHEHLGRERHRSGHRGRDAEVQDQVHRRRRDPRGDPADLHAVVEERHDTRPPLGAVGVPARGVRFRGAAAGRAARVVEVPARVPANPSNTSISPVVGWTPMPFAQNAGQFRIAPEPGAAQRRAST